MEGGCGLNGKAQRSKVSVAAVFGMEHGGAEKTWQVQIQSAISNSTFHLKSFFLCDSAALREKKSGYLRKKSPSPDQGGTFNCL